MRFSFGAVDVEDRMAFGFQIICDQAPVTLPPERLRAHDGGALAAGELQQMFDARFELARVHVVSVSPEGGVSQTVLAESGRGWRRPPSSGKWR